MASFLGSNNFTTYKYFRSMNWSEARALGTLWGYKHSEVGAVVRRYTVYPCI